MAITSEALCMRGCPGEQETLDRAASWLLSHEIFSFVDLSFVTRVEELDGKSVYACCEGALAKSEHSGHEAIDSEALAALTRIAQEAKNCDSQAKKRAIIQDQAVISLCRYLWLSKCTFGRYHSKVCNPQRGRSLSPSSPT